MIKIRPLNESDEGDIAQILNKTWNFDGENDELLESRMYFLECILVLLQLMERLLEFL